MHYLVCFAKADTLASMKSGEKALYSADMYFLIQRQLENLLFSRANALSKSSASVELAYHDNELHELNVVPSDRVKHILGNDILDAESSCDIKPAFHFAGTVSLGQPPPKSQTNVAFVIGHLCWDSSRDFKDFALDDADESGPHPDMVPIYLMPGPDRPERLESPAPIAAWTVVNQSNKSLKLVMDALFQGEATHNATVETTTEVVTTAIEPLMTLVTTCAASLPTSAAVF